MYKKPLYHVHCMAGEICVLENLNCVSKNTFLKDKLPHLNDSE
jgi:hypothetical protein